MLAASVLCLLGPSLARKHEQVVEGVEGTQRSNVAVDCHERGPVHLCKINNFLYKVPIPALHLIHALEDAVEQISRLATGTATSTCCLLCFLPACTCAGTKLLAFQQSSLSQWLRCHLQVQSARQQTSRHA